jgi:cytochrome c biogenesis protein CcmG/thiol:disulfide interchange protein DsbE
MSRNLRMGLLLAAGILLMGGSAFMVWRAGRTTQAAPAQPASAQSVLRFASDPQPAPHLLLKDLAGNVTSMDDLKGKAVLMNFWATWCPPCRAEIPALIELQKRHQDRLQIIGVSEDDNVEDVRAFVKKMGMNYPIVMATPELIQAYGGVSALPTTFVVDPQGRVVQRHLGLLDTATTELEVRSLTGLPVDARVEHFEDTGEIFSKNIEKATELPGVDFTGLTADQKKEALRRMNSETCTCGCKMTVAQCRVNDDTCPVSQALAASIVKDVREGKPAPATVPESN